MRRAGAVLIVGLMVSGALNAPGLLAQSPAAATGSVSFEVVSITPNKSADPRMSVEAPPGRLRATIVRPAAMDGSGHTCGERVARYARATRGPQGFGRLSMRAVPIAEIGAFLSSILNRVVLDRTGLTGNFDLDLQWTPDLPLEAPGRRAPGTAPLVNGQVVDLNGPTIFAAVEEQLGLKLDSQTGPVDVLVIDSAEHPTEN